VACAYGYYWNPDGDYSLGKVLSQAELNMPTPILGKSRTFTSPGGQWRRI